VGNGEVLGVGEEVESGEHGGYIAVVDAVIVLIGHVRELEGSAYKLK
jgi:hypothetical protein